MVLLIVFHALGSFGASIQYNTFIPNWSVSGPHFIPQTQRADIISKTQHALRHDVTQALPDKLLDPHSGNGVLNFNVITHGGEELTSSSYALTQAQITSEEELEVTLSVGVDEYAVIFLGTEKVLECRGNGTLIVDSSATTITLQKGDNTLTAIVFNTGNEWGMLARLLPARATHTLELSYWLDPLPCGISTLPAVQVILLNSHFDVMSTHTVHTWRRADNRATYILHFQSDPAPMFFITNTAVPYMQQNDLKIHHFKPGTPQEVGRPGNLAITGNVVDQRTKDPVAYAMVSLADNPKKTTLTNSGGAFLLSHVDPAHSRLTISSDRYKTKTISYNPYDRTGYLISLEPAD